MNWFPFCLEAGLFAIGVIAAFFHGHQAGPMVIVWFIWGMTAGARLTLWRHRDLANTSIFISKRRYRQMILEALERKLFCMPGDELLRQIDAVNDAELGDFMSGYGPIKDPEEER